MSKVAIILSGCGVYDGSEIYESVLTMLRLDSKNVEYSCFAPDMKQHHVINHANGEESTGESRNVLVEAARLARGTIENLAKLDASKFDGLISPGGFGAAKNLSDFAFKNEKLTIQPDVAKAVKAFHAMKKPIGMICIAPAMAGVLFGQGVECTIGSDKATADILEKTGITDVACSVDNIVVDSKNKLVTTPAYMLGKRISDVAKGINKLVDQIVELI